MLLKPGGLTVVVMREGESESQTYRLSAGATRWIRIGGATALILGVSLIVSWGLLAVQAARVPELEAEVTRLEATERRVAVLAEQLRILEARYEGIRGLFGGRGAADEAPDLWLPPSGAAGRQAGGSDDDALPTSWPLSERGFITQGLLEEGAAGEHPGLDVAVPTDSYVRAAGSGVVVAVGEDPVYGRFLRIDHENGYLTLYAHASQTFVREGERVRRNEVVALSGSTGRSTAPHLHFEILLEGDPVDPLTMVTRP